MQASLDIAAVGEPALMNKIALIQMNSSSRVEDNLKLAEHLLTQASQNNATLAVLPENFSQMPLTEKQRLEAAEEPGKGPIQEFLSTVSSKLNLWLIAGTISIKTNRENKVFSSCLCYDNHGKFQARYDKQHLFDVDLANGESYRESSFIKHGDELKLVDTPLGKVGLSICYDLRFPEYYRLLSQQNVQLLTVPAAFTYTTGLAHWLPLLQARAIENQCYVIAPAQTGTHDNGRTTYGHSVAFDPWGKRIALLNSDNGVVFADIDLNYLNEVRSQIPCLMHRRM